MSLRENPRYEGKYGTVNPSVAVALGEQIAKRLRALGVTLKPGNRLERAQRVAAELASGQLVVTRENATAQEWASEALRTIWEFALVAGTVREGHAAKLEEMLTGAAVARQDTNTRGRDTQFEYLIAALFATGGVTIRGQEPDLRFLMGEQELGLAVKRVRSPKKLRARVSAGVQQLQANGVDGLVVVNVEPFLEGLSTDGGAEAVGRRFHERVAPLRALFRRYQGRPRMIGVIGAGTVVECTFDGPRYRFTVTWFQQFRWFTDDPREQEQIEVFFHGMRTRLEKRLIEFFGG